MQREAPASDEGRIRYVYALALGRLPTKVEMDLGMQMVASGSGSQAWERYCQLILCTNEFLYVE